MCGLFNTTAVGIGGDDRGVLVLVVLVAAKVKICVHVEISGLL